MPAPAPRCDEPLILPPEALPAHAVPVGVILSDDSVVDLVTVRGPATRQ